MSDIMALRRRLTEYAQSLHLDVWSTHEDEKLFTLARDYVDAVRREREDALREKLK